MDIVFLAGIYHTTCAILNAFDVPAPPAATPVKERLRH